jgi:hypothetical protein
MRWRRVMMRRGRLGGDEEVDELERAEEEVDVER